MSARTHTGLLGRALAVAGAGLMACTASVAMAPAAGADDMDRAPQALVDAVEAQPWPHYELGDVHPDIRGAYRALGQQGYESSEETSELGEALQTQIIDYQRDAGNNLPVTGNLDDETWLLLREETYADEYLPGDGPDNGREWGVLGIQELLMKKYAADIDNTGYYDEPTFHAVCDAQEHLGLDVDGFVGRLTWRSIITDDNWEETGSVRDTPGASRSREAPRDFLSTEEALAQYSCDDRA